MKFTQFSSLEALEYTSYKHLYVDLCGGDLIAGILLSKIIYWFGTSPKNGQVRCKHVHHGRVCLVKQRTDWFDECRISPKQFDHARAILEKLGFISVEIKNSPFHMMRNASFIFMNEETFMNTLNAYLLEVEGENRESTFGEFGNLPLGNSGIDQTGIPYTVSRNTANDHGHKGIAPKSPNPKKPDKPKEAVKALPSSKGKEALKGVRKFKRSKEHQIAFDWLVEQALTDDQGQLADVDTISFLSSPSQNSLEKLQKCYAYMSAKITAEGKEISNTIGYFRKLLKSEKDYMQINETLLENNIKLAQQFAIERKWSHLKIRSKFATDDRYPGYDINLSLPTENVLASLENLYRSMEERFAEKRHYGYQPTATFDPRIYDGA